MNTFQLEIPSYNSPVDISARMGCSWGWRWTKAAEVEAIGDELGEPELLDILNDILKIHSYTQVVLFRYFFVCCLLHVGLVYNCQVTGVWLHTQQPTISLLLIVWSTVVLTCLLLWYAVCSSTQLVYPTLSIIHVEILRTLFYKTDASVQ